MIDHLWSSAKGLVELGATFIRGLKDVEDCAAAARQTLEFLAHGGFKKPWLLILDNVDNPAVLRCLAPLGNCHLLLTTRLSGWSSAVATIPIDVWPQDQAVDYLVKESGREDLAGDGADEIVKAVDCLPLALSHAAALLRARPNITASSYLETLIRRMRETPADAEYERAVFATFETALEEAERQATGARAIMALAAFLAPDNVPEELLHQPSDCYPEVFRSIQAKPGGIDDALGSLIRLSLVRFAPASRTFSAHRLVLAAVRDGLGDDCALWASVAVSTLRLAFPKMPSENWRVCERLITHIHTATSYKLADSRELAWLLSDAGSYLQDRGGLGEAVESFKISFAISMRLAMANPSNTETWRDLSIVHNKIGDVEKIQGDIASASESYRSSLRIRERLAEAEPEDNELQRDLSVSFNRIGDAQRMQGDLDNALDSYHASHAIVARLANADPENTRWQQSQSRSPITGQ